MKIRTPSDLKYWQAKLGVETYFFTRDTMRFFGDTMRNYGIKNHGKVIELLRKRPVKHGMIASAYFYADTIKRVIRDEEIAELLK
jgi:hypothetical protein